jgi:hypothetical protein
LHRPIGIIGKFFNDWNYALIYDLGGSSDGFGGAAPGSLAGLAVWLLFAFFWQMLCRSSPWRWRRRIPMIRARSPRSGSGSRGIPRRTAAARGLM